MSRIVFDPQRELPRVLRPPVSKSDGVRSLLLRHLVYPDQCEFDELPSGERARVPNDMRVMARGLEQLRTESAPRIDCEDAGSVLRLLLTQAAILPGRRTELLGTERLGARPLAELVDALCESLGPAGLRIEHSSPWPISVVGAGRSAAPVLRLRSAASSQFASSLVLGAAALSLREGRAWSVAVPPLPASQGYFDLTLEWLRRTGFAIEAGPTRVDVTGHHAPAEWPALPGDWSSAGYLLAIAWRAGATVRGLDLAAPHPDRSVVDHLRSVGLELRINAAGDTEIHGTPRRGLEVRVSDAPDSALTLAALACVLPAPSRFTEVEILRSKESDRLEGLHRLVRAANGSVTRDGDGLRIEPSREWPCRFAFDATSDHRIAMAAATLAVLTGATLELEGAETVAKSFPDFWEQLGVAST